jgi:hypothetical protein
VVNGGTFEDGSIADVPWASVFDPEINMRAIGEIQARGFRAASEVVDRLTRAAKTGAAPGEQQPGFDEEDRNAHSPPDVDRVVEMGQKMLGQLVQALRGTSCTADAAAAFDLAADHSSGRITVEAAAGSVTAAAEVWLHNPGSTDLGKVLLRCSDLLAHDGAVIPASAVRFEPDTVPMPARCSRGVTMEIDLVGDPRPGRYHGTLLADGHVGAP